MQLRWRFAQFCELLWWRLYLARKSKKEYLAWKRFYWTNFLKHNDITIPRGVSVFDAGCGPAGLYMILDQQHVDALDPLLDKYARAFRHFSPTDYPWVQFYCQSLESFEPPVQYDFVVALNAINHVDQLDKCLDKLAALAKPGGLLLISVDAHRYRWLRHIFKILPADILHPHQYTLMEYQAMLRRRGLQILKTTLLKKQAVFNYYLLIATMPALTRFEATSE